MQSRTQSTTGADVDDLKVTTAFVDEGMTMKRIRPRERPGRPNFKRTCHITVKVGEAGGGAPWVRVHRLAFVRITGIIRPCGMRRGDYADKLFDDIKVREFLEAKLKNAQISKILIERPAQNARVTLQTARPGIVIGKKGEDVESLRKELTQMMGIPVQINIEEIRKPELDARLVAQNIAGQLERRVMFRRAMKRAVQNAMRAGAEGIRSGSGRLWC